MAEMTGKNRKMEEFLQNVNLDKPIAEADWSSRLPQIPEKPTEEYKPEANSSFDLESITFGTVALEDIIPDQPYILANNETPVRYLCSMGQGTSTWQWAYWGTKEDNLSDIIPIRFAKNTATGKSSIYIQLVDDPAEPKFLFSNTSSTVANYLFWGTRAYLQSYPGVQFQMTADQYYLWKFGETDHYLTASWYGG
eukprot:TRINITY_DN10122_c0_g1_i1.p1 TRINITY_DN10122_c0_g1~~TRINITY_DN10122_c0_g1_i1.p1  ORF type:complete len:195 (-),score=28.13 TRINITY_DN10122_c0_g1_i1:233-817(-)